MVQCRVGRQDRYEAQLLLGFVAATDTSATIVSRLSQEIARMVHGAEIGDRKSALVALPAGSFPEGFTMVLETAVNRLDELIKQTGHKLE